MSPVNQASSVSTCLRMSRVGLVGSKNLVPGDRDETELSHKTTAARETGTKLSLEKIASLSRHSGKNGTMFVLYVFPR